MKEIIFTLNCKKNKRVLFNKLEKLRRTLRLSGEIVLRQAAKFAELSQQSFRHQQKIIKFVKTNLEIVK